MTYRILINIALIHMLFLTLPVDAMAKKVLVRTISAYFEHPVSAKQKCVLQIPINLTQAGSRVNFLRQEFLAHQRVRSRTKMLTNTYKGIVSDVLIKR